RYVRDEHARGAAADHRHHAGRFRRLLSERATAADAAGARADRFSGRGRGPGAGNDAPDVPALVEGCDLRQAGRVETAGPAEPRALAGTAPHGRGSGAAPTA